jgi:L-lactate utilization protein LutB
LRSEITSNGSKRNPAERIAFKLWAKVMTSPALYNLGALAGRIIQKVMPLAPAWTKWRDLRPIEQQSFRSLWKSKLSHEQ